MNIRYVINSNGKIVDKWINLNGQQLLLFGPTIPMPNPTPAMLNNDPLFDSIWETIKNWDINVPTHYVGYCGANGSHVALIYNAIIAKGL